MDPNTKRIIEKKVIVDISEFVFCQLKKLFNYTLLE